MRLVKIIASALMVALPALALASSGGEGHANPWLDIALKFVNFFGLIAILYFALRKSVPTALKSRRDSIAKELRSALEAKEAAEKKLDDYKRKVSHLQDEVAKLKEDYKTEGAKQKERILAEAAEAAEAIRKNAQAAGEREVRRISDELRTEAVAKALELAEQILIKSYGAEDQKKALEQTIGKIKELH